MSGIEPQIEPQIFNGSVDLLLVGRDLGTEEVKKGKPFANMDRFQGAGYVLEKTLTEVGLRRKDLLGVTNVVNRHPPGNNFPAHGYKTIEAGRKRLMELVERLDPNCVLTFGNEAAYALIPDWPTKTNKPDQIQNAKGIRERRGYIWEGRHGGKVVTTVHPASIQRGSWVPFKMLLTEDLKKAKAEAAFPEFDWPERDVIIPHSQGRATDLVEELRQEDRLSADIELYGDHSLLCVGFGINEHESVVFPAEYLETITPLLVEDSPRLIWANGQFDAHYLLSRNSILPTVDDDTQLGWHALYPSLAGKSKQKSFQMTRKSLAFLAALHTRQPWWKDYDVGEEGMMQLNGVDCCVTCEIMRQIEREIDQQGVRDVYEHNLSLVEPTVKMQMRGLLVDDELRQQRIGDLSEMYDELHEEINELVIPLIKERSDRIDGLEIAQTKDALSLFKNKWTCPCCRNGSKKKESCVDCADVARSGSNDSILKSDLVEAVERLGLHDEPSGLKKDELRELLPPCQECDGVGQETWIEMNPTSNSQIAAVLYEILKLPKRRNKGSLTTDENALRSILGEV